MPLGVCDSVYNGSYSLLLSVYNGGLLSPAQCGLFSLSSVGYSLSAQCGYFSSCPVWVSLLLPSVGYSLLPVVGLFPFCPLLVIPFCPLLGYSFLHSGLFPPAQYGLFSSDRFIPGMVYSLPTGLFPGWKPPHYDQETRHREGVLYKEGYSWTERRREINVRKCSNPA